MADVGIGILKELLAWCDGLDRVDDIEAVHEEPGRAIFQVLPLRAEVYSLDISAGQVQFSYRCQRDIDPRQVFAVGTFRGKEGLYGVFAYSPTSLIEDCDFQPADFPSASYDAKADWGRLREEARNKDLAYELTWLKRLYVETYQALTDLVIKREPNMELARRLSVLRDITFSETVDRMIARLEGKPGIKQLKEALDMVLANFSESKREDALRDNPLIWLTFATTSPAFSCFRGGLLQRQLADGLSAGSILPSHVEQTRDLVDLAVECLTAEQAAGARPLVELIVASARLSRDPSFSGYAFMTAGSFEMHVAEHPDLDRALLMYREARDVFKSAAGLEKELDVARFNIKRISALQITQKSATSTLLVGRRFADTEAVALSRYNALVEEGRDEEALTALDEVAANAQHAERIEIESLCGMLLLKLNRLPDAYKRLNRCQNVLDGETLDLPQTGTFELFSSTLLLREHSSRRSADVAAQALARLEHICPLSNRIMLAINLSAAQLDFDLAAAEETASKYEPQASGIDRVYLMSNLSAARVERDPASATEVAQEALILLKSADERHNQLHFDLYFRIAQAALRLQQDPNAVARGLEACDNAFRLVKDLPDSKLRNLYQIQSRLFDSLSSRPTQRLEALEQGFAAAEECFLSIARVEDDIHHQLRMLSGYMAKVGTFAVFQTLFDVYRASERWPAAMLHAQRFKSRFLVEAALAVSENLCAERCAQTFARGLKDGDADFLKTLQLGAVAKKLNEQAWNQSILSVMGETLGVEAELMLRPFSFEQAEPSLYLMSSSGESDRHSAYDKVVDYRLSARRLPPHTALLEMIPLGDKIGVLALSANGDLQWVHEYARVGNASDVSSRSGIAQLKAFNGLAADLARVLAPDTEALIICPSSWAWSVPFAAVRAGEGWLCNRYRIVMSPSAAFHSIASARPRKFAVDGFALVDPRRELQWADQEASSLCAQSSVSFVAPCRITLSPESLREAGKGKYWIHLSAHGKSNAKRLGLDSGLSLYEKDEPGADAALGFADVLWSPFPGLDCGVVVLSACEAAYASMAAEEPMGVATALLVGGAKAVVAPLWDVDEFATLLFFDRFYSELTRQPGRWLSEVVHDTQSFLRSMPRSEVVRQLKKAGAATASPAARDYLNRIEREFDDSMCPYSDFSYWAPFVVVGSDIRLQP